METLNDIRQAARQAIASGDLSYSIGLYEKIFHESKNTPQVEDIINYGAILRKTNQLKKASIHYKRYAIQFNDNIDLVKNACNCWIELKDFDESRVAVQKALKNNIGNTDLLLILGYTELSAGKNQKACNIFQKIIKIDSKHFDGWFNLAVAKAKLGSLEEALACFRRAQLEQSQNQLLSANIITILQDLDRAWEEKQITPAQRAHKIKAVEAAAMTENYVSEHLQELPK